MDDINVITELVTGNIIVVVNTQFNHVHADTITILENVNVRIYGTFRNLILNSGAKLHLHGAIQGNIDNRGGDLLVF